MQNEQIFDLCSEGEQIIKTYECTTIRKLFFGTSKGRLTLTNKRLLYHATGRSIKGKSLALNEMPIDDVSGVSMYMGASVNWIALVVFVSALYFVATPIILKSFPKFLTGQTFGIIALIFFMLFWLWDKNIISNEIKNNVLENLKGLSDNEYTKNIPSDTLKKVSRYLFVYGVFILGLRIFTRELGFINIAVYIALYFFVIGAGQAFSLLVFSKSSKGAGIHLPGVQQFSFLNFRTNETTALDTMSGSPAKDSETVIKELGAIITDLKQMGDLAIEKWQ